MTGKETLPAILRKRSLGHDRNVLVVLLGRTKQRNSVHCSPLPISI